MAHTQTPMPLVSCWWMIIYFSSFLAKRLFDGYFFTLTFDFHFLTTYENEFLCIKFICISCKQIDPKWVFLAMIVAIGRIINSSLFDLSENKRGKSYGARKYIHTILGGCLVLDFGMFFCNIDNENMFSCVIVSKKFVFLRKRKRMFLLFLIKKK